MSKIVIREKSKKVYTIVRREHEKGYKIKQGKQN